MIIADQSDADSTDRRSLRSQQLMIDALIELLAVKAYDSISIKEIIDKANVGRSTFYAHYQNKDDLLHNGFERILDRIIEHIEFREDNQDLIFDSTPLFIHARGHFKIYQTLVWGSGYEFLTKRGHTALSEKIEAWLARSMAKRLPADIPLPVLSFSVAGSLLLLLKWWMDNKMPYPPEQMNDIFQRLVLSSVRRELGLTDLPL